MCRQSAGVTLLPFCTLRAVTGVVAQPCRCYASHCPVRWTEAPNPTQVVANRECYDDYLRGWPSAFRR
jgi:hypothetical protein